MKNNRETGSRYEQKAAAYLAERGYRILEKNYRCRMGEIDLIARDNVFYVFIEVKYRKNADKGYPEEAVNWQKQRRIRQAAQYYLMSRHLTADTPCRFDVVSILDEKITLIQNAFGGI